MTALPLPSPYQLLADSVLVLHCALVVFVVAGLPLIVLGNWRHWRWADSLVFRLAHAGAIAMVVGQAWLGVACPLTTLEMQWREKAQATTYTGSFIEHWLQRLLYYEAPSWVFVAVYSLFALAVAAAWWYYPPRGRRHPPPREAPTT